MNGENPLRYVDVDDADLDEYPQLAESARAGDIPLVQVGGELKYPQSISIYWAEEELKSLGVGPLAVVQGGD
jgi:hypothetical protein